MSVQDSGEGDQGDWYYRRTAEGLFCPDCHNYKLDPIMEENSRPVKKVAEEKEDALGAILHLPPSKVLLFFLVLRFIWEEQ